MSMVRRFRILGIILVFIGVIALLPNQVSACDSHRDDGYLSIRIDKATYLDYDEDGRKRLMDFVEMFKQRLDPDVVDDTLIITFYNMFGPFDSCEAAGIVDSLIASGGRDQHPFAAG